MLKKIGCAMLGFGALVAVDSHAAPAVIHALKGGVTLEYEFPPNSPQEFRNFTYWSIDATCRIYSADDSNDMFAKGLDKKGKINGVELSKGQTMMVTVHNGDNLRISAEPGARVEITNLGKSTVRATCST